MQSTQHSMSFPIVCVILGSVLLVQTFELRGLRCNTDSTPALVDLEIRRLCHTPSENVISCEVSYYNHSQQSLKARHTSCYKYHCKTYWGFFGSYSADRLVSRYTGAFNVCNNGSFPDDPYECNWYYCCSALTTEICRCSINNVTVAVRTFPPFMYCSFADCSTVSQLELTTGFASLSDGSVLEFEPWDISKELINGTFNGTILCNSSSKIISFDEFRRSYSLVNGTYVSSSINITCSSYNGTCRAKPRKKRDLSQIEYLVHKLRPTLRDAWEDCEILQSLLLGVFGTGMASASQFLREWLNQTNIVGYVVNGIGVVWQCDWVNVSFLPWNESTYYPPVNFSNSRLYLNDESRLQTSTPEARPGLKRVLWFGRYFLGTVGSGVKPRRIRYNRTSHDFHLQDFDASLNLTPSINLATGHETDPINHAFGTQANLLPYTRSNNITSTDTGSGWVHIGLPSFAFLNPLGWLRDIFSWAAWIGGILYLITLCISLPASFARRRRLGRW
ncbi:Glycoprotein [Variegated squirrel bornavirus 1]|uniref:Glycoprotein n=1 Tax=Variegated squirrel bornavirus 1 TaxID=1885248 RepID=A0A1D3JBA6_9MONO|nr:Glycoprotein [Variegated squirrel bornavirus 1]SBT82863.1 Glycoprotein [Variegated squirrel bornavirus 1]